MRNFEGGNLSLGNPEKIQEPMLVVRGDERIFEGSREKRGGKVYESQVIES